jgi:hypothetical protein
MALPYDIRPATRDDAPLLLELIGELADYERLRDEVVLDATLLERHLFGERPAAEAVIAEIDGEAVGYALFFPTFSTFLGRPGCGWRTCSCGRRDAGRASGARCSHTSRAWRSRVSADGSSGRRSTGTSRRSRSTAGSARGA